MKKENRRKQILDAAMTVFVEKGFLGSTTLEIAKTAGVSEVTLFRYFSSKKEIFLEGIEPILFSTLEDTINTSISFNTAEKLESILYDRISLISNNHLTVKLILSEASRLSELGSENFMNRILQMFQTMLLQIGVSVNDKEFAIRLLMGSILSFLYLPESGEENIKNYVSKVVSLITNESNK